jgi:hypothetical protein
MRSGVPVRSGVLVIIQGLKRRGRAGVRGDLEIKRQAQEDMPDQLQ